jgi:hypothetical protein
MTGAAPRTRRGVDRARQGSRRSGPRPAAEDGAVGGVEVLPFGVLVFVVGSLLLANAWGVIDAKMAAAAAAREAARAYVEAIDEAEGDAAAQAAATAAIAAHGRDRGRLQLQRTGGTPFVRCARVTFEAAYPVPALALPWVGGLGHGFTAAARHSELVDPLRSGVAGEAHCVR